MQVEVCGIKKAYAKKVVLNGVTFSAGPGSCIGIVGSNGSGKSTLLSVLAGVRRTDGGSFLCDGVDLLRRPGRIPKVLGYVPQENPLMEELNAWDNLRMWYDRRTIQKSLAGGALQMLGVGDFLKTPVRRMSGGMKKRLSIGCAVVSGPGILLLDEPSAALDPVCKERIRSYLEAYRREGGMIVMVTHDAQDLELCNECYILKKGMLHAYQYDGDFHRMADILGMED